MSGLFFHRFDMKVGTYRHDLLLAFLSTDKLDEADFSDKVQLQIERDLIPDEILIVVRDVHVTSIAEQFARSSTLDALMKRIQNKSVISLRAFGPNGRETTRLPVHGNACLQISIETIVRRTITKLVKDRHGFVEAAGSYHFELPSQRHTERFIRISNVLVDAAEISFIAFGLLPYVNSSLMTVYVDTPSLFPVVSALSDHLRAFAPSRGPISIENFRSYSGYASYNFATDPENLVLISASSSGRLAQAILALAPFDADQIVHLLYSGNTDSHQIVCNIQFDEVENPYGFRDLPQDHRAGDCPLCAAHSRAVQLIGDHFELPGPQPTPLVFGVADVNPRFPDLMRRFVGRQALRVGFGRSNQTAIARHFEVSPKALISGLIDSGRLKYVLNQAVPVSLDVIVCLNDASKELAELVLSHIRNSGASRIPTIVMARDLGELFVDQTEDPVLIVAAVVESGRSLQDVSRDLRRPYPASPQIYLVGLAKYLSENIFQRLKNNLVQTHAAIPHEFIAIERIQLPPSSEFNAWTAERLFLSDRGFSLGMAEDEKNDWDGRLNRLRKQSEPLVNELFVSVTPETPIKLQAGFALWPKGLAEKGSQADVYFTIAAILQNLRAKEEEGVGRALRSDLFQHTLIDPGNFGRFSDGIIQASFLRAALPNELNYSTSPKDSRDMARYLRRILESASLPRGEAAAEFLIAMGTKRLRLRPEHYREVLAPIDEELPTRVRRLQTVVMRLLEEEGLLASADPTTGSV